MKGDNSNGNTIMIIAHAFVDVTDEVTDMII